MIDAKELRIGNATSKGVVKTFYDQGVHVGLGRCFKFKDVDPVSLNKEWISRFDKKQMEIFFKVFPFRIDESLGENVWLMYVGRDINVQYNYVHEFQNVFHSLMGEELKAK